MKIYHIDSSARKSESVSKSLAKLLVDKIKKSGDSSKQSTIKTIDQPEAPAFI
jgi:FMN-dependent NADH-azoreductase